MIFKKAVLTIAAFILVASPARALQIRLGEVSPASHANFSQELALVNTLVDLANGLTLDESTYDVPEKTYNLVTDPTAALPHAIATGALDVEEWSSGITLSVGSGFTYLLGKYGNTAVVFYSPDGSFNIGDHVSGIQQGISHYTAFRAERSETRVPDSGSTVFLLGIGIASLAYVRRRIAR